VSEPTRSSTQATEQGHGLDRRGAGVLASSTVALVWTVLAARRPDTTFHFAPLVCAGSWGAARRWAAGGPGSRRAGLVAAAGGLAVAAITVAELEWLGWMDGPTLWGSSGAAVEAFLFAAAGALMGARFVTRRRAGLLFRS
jgi:hypothetical protein